jgi:hypothetical protein
MAEHSPKPPEEFLRKESALLEASLGVPVPRLQETTPEAQRLGVT